MYSSPLSTPSLFPLTERPSLQKQGHSPPSASLPTSNTYALNTPKSAATKTAIPKPSEFLVSAGLGVLGALLLAPLWMRHPLPQHAKSLASLGTVVDNLEHLNQPSQGHPHNHQNELVAFLADPAVLMMMIPVLAPHLTKPALGATAVLGVSYLASNVLSGLQEVWVRWQESQIRATLVGNLSTAYQQSIEAKTQIDDDNHAYAETQIRQILADEGIPNAETYLSPLPFECLPQLNDPRKTRQQDDFRHKQSNFAILPQNRRPLPRQARQGENPAISSQNPHQTKHKKTHPSTSEHHIKPLQNKDDSPIDFKKASRWSLNAVGTGLGFTMTTIVLYAVKAIRESMAQVVQPLQDKLQKNPELINQSIREKQFSIKNTLAPQNTEAVLLHFFQSKKGFVMAGLFVAMGVMLRTTQFLVEGLREIEVTRLNAETEKQYETYKLTVLEPHFKAISERSQLEHALRNLKKDLQEKSLPPEELHQQVQRILDNIAYNWSAPNYYPMSPPAQLVTARS
jgi:hypothetical protein